ncbi:MAG: ROK family protein [Pseudomonadota bacterium]
MTAERHLLIDLGGTHTRVAWGDAQGVTQDSIRLFLNRDFHGLNSVLSAFLTEQPGQPHSLCAGVAGPVQSGTAQLTNYEWFIDAVALKTQTGAHRVALINDLQAQGYALDDIPACALQKVKQGHHDDGPRVVLNLGTGCNCAVVHRVAGRLFVPAAETGHSSLPHAEGDLRALFDHLRTDHAHLPIEAVLSGPGLARVHAWTTGHHIPPEAVITQIAQHTDEARTTLALFLQTLGHVAGNIALHHLPTGGMYLSGGLAKAMAPYLDDPAFLTAFLDRGPYRHIAQAIPIHVITQDSFALHGCHRHLTQSL